MPFHKRISCPYGGQSPELLSSLIQLLLLSAPSVHAQTSFSPFFAPLPCSPFPSSSPAQSSFILLGLYPKSYGLRHLGSCKLRLGNGRVPGVFLQKRQAHNSKLIHRRGKTKLETNRISLRRMTDSQNITYLGSLPPVRCMTCKYILPFHRLPFCFGDGFLYRTETF